MDSSSVQKHDLQISAMTPSSPYRVIFNVCLVSKRTRNTYICELGIATTVHNGQLQVAVNLAHLERESEDAVLVAVGHVGGTSLASAMESMSSRASASACRLASPRNPPRSPRRYARTLCTCRSRIECAADSSSRAAAPEPHRPRCRAPRTPRRRRRWC